LEYFVDGTSDANSDPSAAFESLSVGPDYVNRYWVNNDPKRQGERLSLIREVVDAMPDLEVMPALYEVFTIRCAGCLCNVVHTPTFLKQTEQFRRCLSLASPEARVMAIANTIPMDTLGFYLLALVLGLTFHPVPSLRGWTPTPTTLRIEDLRTTDLHTKTWRSLALRCLHGGASFFCGSIASVQSALMLLLDGQEGSLALDAVLVTAISGAQKLNLHRLGDAILDPSASSPATLSDGSPGAVPSHIRTEVGVRIWWALVLRDWSRGQALGYYTIRPSQFNTRMPLHVNDDDLTLPVWRVDVNGRIPERPRSEFTFLSYTVHALELAVIVRESIDLKGLHSQSQRPEASKEAAYSRTYLHKKYEKFVSGLPPYFRLGSTMGITSTSLPTAAIPVHRWMLHQQMWSLLLRLHRATVSSPVGRSSCQLLAQNIISTQVQIKARCTVCGSLSTGEIQLFNAAVALFVDLLFSCKPENEDELGRLMTRDKIREAIELLRAEDMDLTHMSSAPDPQWDIGKGAARRSVLVLEALMQLEEEEYSKNKNADGTDATGNSLAGQGAKMHSLKSKVINILQGLFNPKNVSVPMEQGQPSLDPYSALDLTMPYSNIPDELPVDVLPILNNDVNSNFWQFLDFPPPPTDFSLANMQFPAPADLQSFGGLSFSSPSAVAHSSTLSTPNFTDGYSTTDGSRFTHPSPASNESESARLDTGSEPVTTTSSDAYVAAKFFYAMDHGTVPSF
jgi:hypothetical protein